MSLLTPAGALASDVGPAVSGHHFSEKHTGRYVAEFAGRHNIRNRDTLDQMTEIVDGMINKRLKYRDLVA